MFNLIRNYKQFFKAFGALPPTKCEKSGQFTSLTTCGVVSLTALIRSTRHKEATGLTFVCYWPFA